MDPMPTNSADQLSDRGRHRLDHLIGPEICENISIGDETLKALLERFGTEGASEINLLGSTFSSVTLNQVKA